MFVGQRRPWDFKKKTQAFSRKLERLCELVFLDDDDAFFNWSEVLGYSVVAIEISENANMLPGYRFPERSAIVVGNEGSGLSAEFLDRCHAVLSIPQFGDVECLNVAVSCAVVMYELNRCREDDRPINRAKFLVGT